MKIVCLGWGSLIWNPGSLKSDKNWFPDGPCLPIEFTRISNDGRVTLIMDLESKSVPTLWTMMTVGNLDSAVNSLKVREGIQNNSLIHFAKTNYKYTDRIKKIISTWAKSKKMDAVIWTGLSYSKKTKNNRPKINEILRHLKNLDPTTLKLAEEYIRKAPKQIDTEYRQIIEQEFGWTS